MIKNKFIWMLGLSIAITSCDVNNELPEILDGSETGENIALNAGSADFSNYIAVGASFTAGYTDGALFKAGQENSFPSTLAKQFAMIGGGEFNQPLMNDNIGGLLYGGFQIQEPRFYFNGAGPARLQALPTTETTTKITTSLNNFGVPGAKSFHLVAPGYGSVAGVPVGASNPYFARFSSSETTTVITDAVSQNPTFFTLSEVGGNDVLGYALAGGAGVDQKGNFDPATYGGSDITDPNVFAGAFSGMVDALTANGAKGVVSNVPYITSLANFTTVPYDALDPSNPDVAAQIPLLNSVYGAVNQIYAGAGEPERSIVFSDTEANPVVVYDEDATDLSAAITITLGGSPTFVPFVESLGLPAAAAPLVAQLLGQQYGKARSATANDLLVLASSAIIGTVNTDAVAALITQSGGLLPVTLAGQFSAHGVTLPLADQWVITPQEQEAIKTATDAYNATIAAIASANPNIVMVDLNSVLTEAATIGVPFDGYNLTTGLVTGGLISLDGVHLTSRGYALMANEMLKAIDVEFGSNFATATNGLAKADDFPTNFTPTLLD